MARADVPANWAELPDEQLLDLRLATCRSSSKARSSRRASRSCTRELEARDLRFPLHFYLSDEWFTPDGTASMAVPFYLAHPRLERLEKAQMLEVEGGEHEWCMRILRHEAGHVIDNAYKLRLRRQRRALFGSSAQPYPEFYAPKPYSKSFVLHLDPVVRAEPSRRGLRRDVRGVADARVELAARAMRAGRRSRSSNTWTR